MHRPTAAPSSPSSPQVARSVGGGELLPGINYDRVRGGGGDAGRGMQVAPGMRCWWHETQASRPSAERPNRQICLLPLLPPTNEQALKALKIDYDRFSGRGYRSFVQARRLGGRALPSPPCPPLLLCCRCRAAANH